MKKAARGAAKPDPAAAKGEKKEPGRKPHSPTKASRKKVRMLASLGFSQEEIGLLMDVGETTIHKYYSHELRVGGLEADVEVLKSLFQAATQTKDLSVASRASIFWAKVRRRWHEVQRVIHGYDPDTIKTFVKSVVSMLRAELPRKCPGCQTELNLGPRIATHLMKLSAEMAAKLPQSEIVPMPVPPLASDGVAAEE